MAKQTIKSMLRDQISTDKNKIKNEIIAEIRTLNEQYASELTKIITEVDTTTEEYKSSHRELISWMRRVSSTITTMRQSLGDEIHRTNSLKLYYYIAGIFLSGYISALTMYVLLTYL